MARQILILGLAQDGSVLVDRDMRLPGCEWNEIRGGALACAQEALRCSTGHSTEEPWKCITPPESAGEIVYLARNPTCTAPLGRNSFHWLQPNDHNPLTLLRRLGADHVARLLEAHYENT